MFTEEYFSRFLKTHRIANLFNYPVIWNSTKGNVYVSPTLWANTVILHVIIVANCLAILYQTVRHNWDHDKSVFSLLLIAFYVLAAFTFGMVPIIFQTQECVCLTNSAILMMTKFNGKKN